MSVIHWPYLTKSLTLRPQDALRAIADEIDAGTHGEVVCVGVVMRGSKGTELFGAGPESTMPVLACLHQSAARTFEGWTLKDITPGAEL
jgi:hypothetical protein